MKYVILHNVRSRHNVGSVFRTSDGAGVAKIFLSGYTPTPIDRFGRPVPEIIKTSLGASGMIPWEKIDDTATLIPILKVEGFTVVSVEQAWQSVPLFDFKIPQNVAYIFGNEINGVPADILALCDTVIEIPMWGQKESLNVSVTAGIVLFQPPQI